VEEVPSSWILKKRLNARPRSQEIHSSGELSFLLPSLPCTFPSYTPLEGRSAAVRQ
jgi:hypothetical protein